ncbi:hypothetical protein L1987_22715 [Smallanthus sonchifolius]|uniref:Uncharacterized protein n=1 Tax=Smallanthus sonchifolius TaxID=185202 RepID=A0ACB9IH40_9ASTR|nr:hypothetical protein L1987_22715 [Smallanthus sonchifolius]
MDLKSSKYIQPPPTFSSSQIHGHGGVRKGLNLKDLPGKTSVVEAPSTPGRPVFSFSVGSSKWNDAEKWLNSDQPQPQNHHLHGFVKSSGRKSSSSGHHQAEEKGDSFDVLKGKQTNNPFCLNLLLCCMHMLKKEKIFPNPISADKFTNEPKFKETSRSRDIGTDMTPLTSRCPTPFKTLSPPRHNTPASRSGPLVESLECHLAKLAPFDSNWTSREEEEEDICESLRHFECRKSISESRKEEEEKTKCCLRYQREEVKIQAWVDLQNAKAEAQSRKLEVKIQRMRSKFEEKLMRKMAIVGKKADELRAAAQLAHTQTIQKVNEEAKKTINMQFNGSCACFPCNNLNP